MMRRYVPGRKSAIFITCSTLLMKLFGFIHVSLLSLWPLILVALSASCDNPKRPDSTSAMTSGILFTYGVMFLACEIFTWELIQLIWPGFLIGPALGLYKQYRVTGSRAQLSQARILTFVGIILILGMILPFRYIIAAIMICAGIVIFISIFKSKR